MAREEYSEIWANYYDLPSLVIKFKLVLMRGRMKGCQMRMSQWRSVEVRGIRKIFSFRNVILYDLLYNQ